MKNQQRTSFLSRLIIAVLICESTGILSSVLSMSSMYPWFAELDKPVWNPPSSVFAPVWTVLYLIMGISLAVIWNKEVVDTRQTDKKRALLIFALQLFLNFWWSIIFFRFHSLNLSFVVICLMIITIIMTTFKFARFSRVASWLLIPYISWVCFAAILNFAIWKLN